MYVCLLRCSFKSILHFWTSFLHVALYKTLFFDFRFRPLTPKKLLPKLCTCTKSPIYLGLYGRYNGDVWAYYGVFGNCRFNGTMQNIVGPTLVAMATKFGLGAEI